MTPILILAAGASSRMRGRDKLLEDVNGVPLLAHVARQALGTGLPVYIALSPLKPARRDALDGLPVQILMVPESAEGMGGTLRGAVGHLPKCDAFFVTLADMPDIETADYNALLDARQRNQDDLIWRAATLDGKAGHPTLFDSALRSEFQTLKGDVGGGPIVKAHAQDVISVPLSGQKARLDLDTPQDWDAWRKGQTSN